VAVTDWLLSFALAFAYWIIVAVVVARWPERVGKGIATRLLRRVLPALVAPPHAWPPPMLELLVLWRVALLVTVAIAEIVAGLSGWPAALFAMGSSALLWVDDAITGADWCRRFRRAATAVKLGVSRLTDGIFIPEPSGASR
jgi:hypothetical protein